MTVLIWGSLVTAIAGSFGISGTRDGSLGQEMFAALVIGATMGLIVSAIFG